MRRSDDASRVPLSVARRRRTESRWSITIPMMMVRCLSSVQTRLILHRCFDSSCFCCSMCSIAVARLPRSVGELRQKLSALDSEFASPPLSPRHHSQHHTCLPHIVLLCYEGSSQLYRLGLEPRIRRSIAVRRIDRSPRWQQRRHHRGSPAHLHLGRAQRAGGAREGFIYSF